MHHGYSQSQRTHSETERHADPLFPTQNYLPREVRVQTIETLNRTLADTVVLQSDAKFAHWNLKGMAFYGLHELFDEIAEVLETHADMIAERVTALGGQAQGTAGLASTNTVLPRMPGNAVTGQEYVQIMADRLSTHDANLREAIDAANRQGDLDTADLLNEVSREVSKHLWFLEAHLQTQPVDTVTASVPAQPGQTASSPPSGGSQSRQPQARPGGGP